MAVGDNKDNDTKKNGWNEWAKYVLEAIKEIKANVKDINDVKINALYKKIDEVKDAVGLLTTGLETQKVRMSRMSAFWGVVGGAIPALVVLAIILVFKK